MIQVKRKWIGVLQFLVLLPLCLPQFAFSQSITLYSNRIFILIRTTHQMILKNPQNRSWKGILTLEVPNSKQGKLIKTKLLRWRKSSIYQLFLYLSTGRQVFAIQRQGFFKILGLRLCTASKLTTVEKMDICSFLRVGKDTGRNAGWKYILFL